MLRTPRRSTRTYTLFPDTTLFLSVIDRLDIGKARHDVGFERSGALRIARLGVVERAEPLDQRGGQRRRVAQRADHRVHAIGRSALAQDRKSTRLNSSH